MKLLSDFGTGFANCFRAFTPLFEKGLWPFLFFNLFIWLGLWILSLYGIVSFAGYIDSLIEPYLSPDSATDTAVMLWLKPKLSGVFGFLIKWILHIIFWFLGSIFLKYFLLIILSPLFALLSEITDEKLSGKKFPFNFSQLLKDVLRGIAISLRNLLFELVISFGLWIVTIFIPPLAIITIPLGFVIGWYFVGFSIMDYNCERYKYNMSKSITFIKQHKGYAIGIGCVYSLFMALPTVAGDAIGIMFGPTLAVIAATMSFLKINETPSQVSQPS